MLVNHDFELPLKLGLLCGVGLSVTVNHGRHILNDKQTHLVASLVKQSGFDFNLYR